jgi:anti-sigma B factor antagonist
VRGDGSEREVFDGTLAVRLLLEGTGQKLSLAGELDLTNAKTFAAELERAEVEGDASITIDMTELEFIDSTGIAALLAAHQRLNENGDGGVRLRLVPSRAGAVQRVMSLTGLDEAIPSLERGSSQAREGT